VVSLGEWTNHVGTVQEQAGTFFHELGHNINLHHGGSDDVNYKPNFLSIMNYSFQTRGLRKNSRDGLFDYSRFLLPVLDETNLDETVGLNGGAAVAAYGTRYFCGAAGKVVNKANKPIDWNCNGSNKEKNVAADVNNDGQQTHLTGFDDWDNLDFRGGGVIGTPSPGVMPEKTIIEPVHELTVAQDRLIPPAAPANVVQHKGRISWTPVGLEIIREYRIYDRRACGNLKLVKVVPSGEAIEENNQVTVTLPTPAGHRYVVTGVDRF
jgi:hypothetical protein